MTVSVPEALAEQQAMGVTKVGASASRWRYLGSSALAGAYVGVGVVLVASAAGPLAAASSPFTTLVAGCVFGVALTLIVFAGAELFTGNAMVMLQGLLVRRVRGADLLAVWGASLVGNL